MTMRKHTFYGILALVSLLGLGITQSARAYSVTLQQVGSNVVASGSGPINLTGLTFFLPGIDFTARIRAGGGVIITGPPGGSGDVDIYTGFTGPTIFGSGFFFFPNTGSGDIVGIDAQSSFGGLLAVPPGYISGTALSDSMTFNNATFASLGVTPGTYVWTWGTGLENQNFTLIIEGAGVPDGGSTVSLLGCALLGLVALRRKLGC
jgi:protein with PEP-CTERM/exosortase system signal